MCISRLEDGTFLEVNDSFVEQLGYCRNELLSMTSEQLGLIDPVDRVNMAEIAGKEGSIRNRKAFIRRKDGQMLQGLIFYEPVTIDYEQCVISVFVDLTKQLQFERELLLAREQTELAMEAKSQFLANISHEIRTPLNGILGMCELLMDSPLNEEQLEFASTIRECSLSFLSIMDQILEYSQLKTSDIILKRGKFNLRLMLTEVFNHFFDSAESKNLTYSLDIHADVPAAVFGDIRWIQKVLTNLLDNAVKFTSEGFVTLKVFPVAGVNAKIGHTIEFQVIDSGPGMPEQRINYFFEAFTQSENVFLKPQKGAGLGLAVSLRLIEMMDGKMEVQSAPGKGSTFSFTLHFPMESDDSAVDGRMKIQKKDIKRILTVTESHELKEVISSMLNGPYFKLEFTETENGLREKLSTKKLDIVLMDMHMSHLNPAHCCNIIRNPANTILEPQIRIAVIARDDFPGLREFCLRFGIEKVLHKPLDKAELISSIEQILELIKDDSRQLKKHNTNSSAHAVFDQSGLLVRIGNDVNLMKDLAALFVQDTPAVLNEIQDSAQKNNFPKLADVAHTLKGSTSNIGALEMMNYCVKLLQAAKGEDAGTIARLIPELLAAFDTFKTSVERLD